MQTWAQELLGRLSFNFETSLATLSTLAADFSIHSPGHAGAILKRWKGRLSLLAARATASTIQRCATGCASSALPSDISLAPRPPTWFSPSFAGAARAPAAGAVAPAAVVSLLSGFAASAAPGALAAAAALAVCPAGGVPPALGGGLCLPPLPPPPPFPPPPPPPPEVAFAPNLCPAATSASIASHVYFPEEAPLLDCTPYQPAHTQTMERCHAAHARSPATAKATPLFAPARPAPYGEWHPLPPPGLSANVFRTPPPPPPKPSHVAFQSRLAPLGLTIPPPPPPSPCTDAIRFLRSAHADGSAGTPLRLPTGKVHPRSPPNMPIQVSASPSRDRSCTGAVPHVLWPSSPTGPQPAYGILDLPVTSAIAPSFLTTQVMQPCSVHELQCRASGMHQDNHIKTPGSPQCRSPTAGTSSQQRIISQDFSAHQRHLHRLPLPDAATCRTTAPCATSLLTLSSPPRCPAPPLPPPPPSPTKCRPATAPPPSSPCHCLPALPPTHHLSHQYELTHQHHLYHMQQATTCNANTTDASPSTFIAPLGLDIRGGYITRQEAPGSWAPGSVAPGSQAPGSVTSPATTTTLSGSVRGSSRSMPTMPGVFYHVEPPQLSASAIRTRVPCVSNHVAPVSKAPGSVTTSAPSTTLSGSARGSSRNNPTAAQEVSGAFLYGMPAAKSDASHFGSAAACPSGSARGSSRNAVSAAFYPGSAAPCPSGSARGSSRTTVASEVSGAFLYGMPAVCEVSDVCISGSGAHPSGSARGSSRDYSGSVRGSSRMQGVSDVCAPTGSAAVISGSVRGSSRSGSAWGSSHSPIGAHPAHATIWRHPKGRRLGRLGRTSRCDA